jgi:hypothetical protein
MARKILLQTSNTIDLWRQKINTMSGYIGDLDSLDSTFTQSTPRTDTSIVAALNELGDLVDKVNFLFNGAQSVTVTAKILADSGKFDKITLKSLYNYDSAMPDSSVHGRYYLGDSPGTDDFDFNVDSVKFGNVTVQFDLTMDSTLDSATFGRLMILDSMFIQTFQADSGADVTFKKLKLPANALDNTVDSALVLEKITIGTFISDSGSDSGVHIDSAVITNLIVDSQIVFADSPDRIFTKIRPFLFTDSLGRDSLGQNVADSGAIYFAAYQLIDSI